jgi:hypothetical protein
MRSALTRARLVSDKPLDLDKHRGMAEQKAADIRRILADVELFVREPGDLRIGHRPLGADGPRREGEEP